MEFVLPPQQSPAAAAATTAALAPPIIILDTKARERWGRSSIPATLLDVLEEVHDDDDDEEELTDSVGSVMEDRNNSPAPATPPPPAGSWSHQPYQSAVVELVEAVQVRPQMVDSQPSGVAHTLPPPASEADPRCSLDQQTLLAVTNNLVHAHGSVALTAVAAEVSRALAKQLPPRGHIVTAAEALAALRRFEGVRYAFSRDGSRVAFSQAANDGTLMPSPDQRFSRDQVVRDAFAAYLQAERTVDGFCAYYNHTVVPRLGGCLVPLAPAHKRGDYVRQLRPYLGRMHWGICPRGHFVPAQRQRSHSCCYRSCSSHASASYGMEHEFQ